MKNFLMNKLLALVGTKLNGKKTYAGAVGKILTGLATLCGGLLGILGIMFPEQGFPKMEAEVCFGAVSLGCASIFSGIQGIGIGHKIEKAASNGLPPG